VQTQLKYTLLQRLHSDDCRLFEEDQLLVSDEWALTKLILQMDEALNTLSLQALISP